HRNQIEALLVTGDGQAFAALAQDPTLARPDVIVEHGEYAYRAQRPLWGYLAWAGSLGRPDVVGWALAALAVLAAGLACAVCARLLEARSASPWWALLLLAIGYESIITLTPELFAFALFGAGLLRWSRGHGATAIALFAASALTRETMLLSIAAVALFELVHADGGLGRRFRQLLPFGWPFLAVLAWDTILRIRLGSWPVGGGSEARTSLPFVGLMESFANALSPGLVVGVVVAVGVCVCALRYAPRDVLTWVSIAYALFATTFSEEVWVHAGFTRNLLPMFVSAFVATLGGLRQRAVQRGGADARAGTRGLAPLLSTTVSEPAGRAATG
ncbi:MAG TPA: hypothetical protein VFZ17_13790, partial [Acidimicrobiia bacterium]|nr:hypothetical protein [Acidimicrobiia bacterium]